LSDIALTHRRVDDRRDPRGCEELGGLSRAREIGGEHGRCSERGDGAVRSASLPGAEVGQGRVRVALPTLFCVPRRLAVADEQQPGPGHEPDTMVGAVGAAAEIVATGIRFAEGPVWCGDDILVCTSVAEGALERIHVETGLVERIAVVGGGANAAQRARDGGFVVTQNGGIDYAALGLYRSDPPAYRPVTPGIQRVAPDGSVSYLADTGFLAPNDLVVAADGQLWFTDPPHHPPPPDPVGRVHTMTPDGETRVVYEGFVYCNGIALEPDGTPVVVEAAGLQRLLPDGDREWIVEHIGDHPGDGFC